MKRLLLLVPTTSYRTEDFIEAANKLGVELIVGTDEAQSLSEVSSERLLSFDFKDIEAGARQIEEFAASRPLDAVLAVDDGGNALSARACELLGLRHSHPGAVATAKNKYRFRDKVARAGLPSPAYRLVHIDEDPAQIAREIGFPCIIKPLTLAMSRGVIRADGHNSFVAAFHRVKDIIAAEDAHTPGEAADHLLIEGFIEGPEYALEGLIQDGVLKILAIFDKPDPLDGPFFEETIYVSPAPISAETREEILQAVQAHVEAIGLDDGPVHVDLRIATNGVNVIELDPRTIGGRCGRSLQFPGGMRLEEVNLRHALDLEVEPAERQDGAGGVMMIPIPRSGILEKVTGLEEARQVSNIQEASITIPLGDRVVGLPEGGRYLGFIIAQGASAAEVTQSLRQAHEKLTFYIN